MTTSTLLVKNVRFLVTCDDGDRLLEHVNLYAENGVITYIGQEEKTAHTVIDGSQKIVFPGLVNTHHHLYQTFSRNLPEVQKMELFPWLKTLYNIWQHLNEPAIYYSSMVGLGELLKTGCTTCMDHHYVFPENTNHILDNQFAAADALGIRLHAARGSMDLSVKDGGLPPDSVVQSIDSILKDCEKAVNDWHDPSPFSMHQVVLAPCSPFSVTEALLRESAVLARDLHVRLHTHLAETKDEERYTIERYNLRPLAYMEKLGWLGDDVWYAHGIHFNSQELKLLAQTGTGVAHCPVSNMKLSSGIARIPDMLEGSVPVGLAVDGSASNDGSSLLEEIRVAYLLHRLNGSVNAPDGYTFLKMATRGSAKLLGRDDIGQLAVGKAADFFMIDTQKLELTGALEDPKNLLATVGYKGSVDCTVVAGKIVVQDGRLTEVDENEVVWQAQREVKRYLSCSRSSVPTA